MIGISLRLIQRIGFVAALLCTAQAWALEVSSHQPSLPLGTEVEYVVGEQFTLESLINQVYTSDWQSSEQETPTFGFDHRPYWFHVTLQHSEQKPIHKIVELAYPALDHANFYLVHNGVVEDSAISGDKVPFDHRRIQHRNPLFKLTLQPDVVYHLFIKVQTEGSLQVPLTLWNPDSFWTRDINFMVVQGLFYGTLIIMGIYNLFIFLVVRDKNYLIYVCSVFSFVLFQASLYGLSFQYLWPNNPLWNDYGILIGISAFGFFSVSFSNSFLQLKQYLPVAHKIMLFVALWCLINFITIPFIPYQYAIQIGTLPAPFTSIVALVSGIILVKRGHKHARYFTLAWFTFLIGLFVLALNKFGVLPRMFLTEYASQIGAAMEVVLISFALGDRINQARDAAFQAQQKALANEKIARIEQAKRNELEIKTKEEELKAQQQIIEAKAESKAKSQFLATMSHEIRTPMNGVLGMAELLKNTELNSQQKQYVNVINQSGKTLLNIINDILDLSKIEAGKMELEQVDINLEQLISECASVFQLGASNKSLEFVAYIQPGTPQWVLGDPTRLRQILLNLLGNALKFTQQGHIILKVEKESHSNDKALIQFTVQDTGIGIPREKQRHLFKMFSQAHTSTSRQFGGTGLGLSICRNLTELMGGHISVESNPDQGTRFVVKVPLVSMDEQLQHQNETRDLQNKQVMIISPSLVMTEIMSEVISSWGMTVISCHSSETALELLNKSVNSRPINLIYLDAPTSQESARRIALDISHISQYQAIPKILSSMDAVQQDQAFLDKTGIVLTIHRPCSVHLLKDFFRTALGITAQLNSEDPEYQTDNENVLSNLKVLVAEDNSVNQLVIQNMLKNLGVAADYVLNGAEAVGAFNSAKEPYDLILMDCEMPELDGFQATETIRDYESKLNQLPAIIIALTAHVMPEYREKTTLVGMDDYLAKPLELNRLKEKLVHYASIINERQSATRDGDQTVHKAS